MKLRYVLLSVIASLLIAGCAEIEPPAPEKLLSPFSSLPNVRLGNTKEDVLSRWGEPDQINEIGVDELGVTKEEWVYNARYPMVPVDYQYVSKTKYLYFEGNILVRQETKSIPNPQEKAEK